MRIPPPLFTQPFVIAKPLRTVSEPSPLVQVTRAGDDRACLLGVDGRHLGPVRAAQPNRLAEEVDLLEVGAWGDDDLIRIHRVLDGGLDRAVRVPRRPAARSGAVVVIDVDGDGVGYGSQHSQCRAHSNLIHESSAVHR
jgi:hypothetical protein